MAVGLPHTLMQGEYANHPRVLCSKGMVLNARAKGVVRHQVGVMKLNVSKPST